MFAVFFSLSVWAVVKLPKARVSKRIKPYLIGGSIAFTLFYACDILSLYVSSEAEANIRTICITAGLFCVIKYLGQCIGVAMNKERVRLKYERENYKKLS